MGKKSVIKEILVLVWQGFSGLITPFLLYFVYMFLSGNGKGYGYDLKSEQDIYTFFAVIIILLWLSAIIPGIVFAVKKYKNGQKKAFLSFSLVYFAAVIIGLILDNILF